MARHEASGSKHLVILEAIAQHFPDGLVRKLAKNSELSMAILSLRCFHVGASAPFKQESHIDP